jgi:GntR family transcriptional regulator
MSDDVVHPPLATLLRISHDTAEPVYRQLAGQIERLIASGAITAGSTLPAERDLAVKLGVSRTTIQQCYNTLRDSGVVISRGRLGSIVSGSPRLDMGMDRLKGFTEEMKELGKVPSSEIIEHTVGADADIAALFGMPSDTKFLHLVRVRYGDNVPLSHERAWYSIAAAPRLEQADFSGSMYEALTNMGVKLVRCEQSIEAATPSPEACEVFGFTQPQPCLLIKRRSYSADQRMVEYVEGLFRGDAYTYRLKLAI